MTAAHLRAYAALAVIDEYNALPTNRQGGVAERNHHAALERLGDALHAIYGPLPDLRVRGWDDDDDGEVGEIPRDAKCGTEDGYRWHLAHDATPCRPCRLAFDEATP